MKKFTLLSAVIACSMIPIGSATEAKQATQTTSAPMHGAAASALKQDMR